jgi:hypothetical protein
MSLQKSLCLAGYGSLRVVSALRVFISSSLFSGVVALLHAPVDESAVEFHFVVADEIVQEGSNGAAVFILENPVCAHAAAAAIAGEGADERHDGIFNV